MVYDNSNSDINRILKKRCVSGIKC
jgi:hypothetical protein